ncbi:MAG TPA: OmpH family outer membrane protein [Thermoanaerobaculaceae bacterium]|nr:OmpH family outer membrane protein [Thermoanaerobaculaceae bacterium]HPS78591.1 OmpH family outer membrane protein [Thermoanaerobaculaceae bacterium]
MSLGRFLSLVAVVALVAGSAMAQAPEPTKLGFVDVERAVFAIDEGKARLKELDAWARPRQEELSKLGKEINDLQAEIVSKRGVASQDALDQLQQRLVGKQRQIEDRQRVVKREFEEKQDAVLKDIGGRMQQIIQAHAEKTGYLAVFLLKPNDVAYLAPVADLTETIVKAFNEKYPVKAAAAPAAGK